MTTENEQTVTLTRSEAEANLERLKARYADQWYGLDNASDNEIVETILGIDKR